jgi:hypothetical protein
MEETLVSTVPYFNCTSGPLAVALNNGMSCVMLPKKWTEIPGECEGSSSLLEYRRRKFVVRSPLAGEVSANSSSQTKDNRVENSLVATTDDVPAATARLGVTEFSAAPRSTKGKRRP